MTGHQELVLRKVNHLKRMAGYLEWSLAQVRSFIPVRDWSALTAEQHESLAAFRIRFREFQEHIGKSMRAIAIEEEKDSEPFGAVLAYMEKLRILDSAEHWKLIRELRNSVNHEYEDNPSRLSEFFRLLTEETPVLLEYAKRLETFCGKHYSR